MQNEAGFMFGSQVLMGVEFYLVDEGEVLLHDFLTIRAVEVGLCGGWEGAEHEELRL